LTGKSEIENLSDEPARVEMQSSDIAPDETELKGFFSQYDGVLKKCQLHEHQVQSIAGTGIDVYNFEMFTS
jgi:hypothetical protein